MCVILSLISTLSCVSAVRALQIIYYDKRLVYE